MTCHFVFDVKLDGSFTRKARFCANGSKTDVPTLSTSVKCQSFAGIGLLVHLLVLRICLSPVDILQPLHPRDCF